MKKLLILFAFVFMISSASALVVNNASYNSTTYETAYETFIVNVSWDNITYSSIAANFIYNDNSYSTTQSSIGNTSLFSYSLDIPLNLSGTYYTSQSSANESGGGYFNYSKPATSTYSANATFSSACGPHGQISIPQTCFDYYSDKIALQTDTTGTPTVRLFCQNSSGFSIIYTSAPGCNTPVINSVQWTTYNQTDFQWNFYLNGTNTDNSSIYQQVVQPTTFGLCSATNNVPFVNFTFKDETDLSSINATIVSGTFEYYLGSGTITKSLSFTNTTENPSYSFCSSPSDRNLYVDSYIPYASTNYPQRIFNPSVKTYSSSVSNQILYLLSSTDGLYVTFQVINAAEQSLQGVFANATRSISGTETLVAEGTTGADGGITMWLNPDVIHTACFSLVNYNIFCTTQMFTQSTYTISLGGDAGNSNVSDYQTGIDYSFRPTDSYLSNGTYYLFNFTLSSSYWALDSFGFNITNGSGSLLASNSSTSSSGGDILLNVSTGQNSSFYITYYWIVNGTTTQSSRSYLIIDLSDTSFSIANLINRFTGYVNSDPTFFGLNDFGLGLLSFLLILVVTGTIKTKYGLSNAAALLGVIFGLVAFLDVSLGVIPNPIGAVSNFPTIMTGVLFAGFLFKEVFK